MNRRGMLASTAAATASLLAGCSGETTPDSKTTSPDADTEAGDTTGSETGSPIDSGTDTATSTGRGTPSFESASDQLRTVYEAWVKLDADAFLATLHSTNNHPEDEVRNSANDIDFQGTLVELNATLVNENPDRDAISKLFETGPNLTEDDVSTFTDVQTVIATVNPTVDGNTANETQANFKSFLEAEKRHLLAVEDGEWRFVL